MSYNTSTASLTALQYSLRPFDNKPRKSSGAAVSVQDGVFYSYAKPLATCINGTFYLLRDPNSTSTTARHWRYLHSNLCANALADNLFLVEQLPTGSGDEPVHINNLRHMYDACEGALKITSSTKRPLRTRYVAADSYNKLASEAYTYAERHGITSHTEYLPVRRFEDTNPDPVLLARFALEGWT